LASPTGKIAWRSVHGTNEWVNGPPKVISVGTDPEYCNDECGNACKTSEICLKGKCEDEGHELRAARAELLRWTGQQLQARRSPVLLRRPLRQSERLLPRRVQHLRLLLRRRMSLADR
jgi:hypothetical protein